MFKRILMTTASAAILAGLAIGAAAPSQAQVGIEIGPRGPRVYDDRDGYRPVIERRERRVIVDEDDDEECRFVVERRVNRFGESVTRRTRVCD